jgi:hypothetical protein
MSDSKETSFSEEVKKLKKLLEEGDITKQEFEKAKEKFLNGDSSKEINISEEYKGIDEEKLEEKEKKKRNTFYTIVSITTILIIFLLGGGIFTGIIIGSILGILSYLIGISKSSVWAKYLVFIILSLGVYFVALLIINPSSSDISTSPSTSSPADEALSAYYECRTSCYDSYHSRWEETCSSKGESSDCLLPDTTVQGYDETLQNELDRCVVRYADKILADETKYYDCRDSAYDNYHDRWNGSCENLGKAEECQLPSTQADTYGESLERELDRCVLLFQ